MTGVTTGCFLILCLKRKKLIDPVTDELFSGIRLDQIASKPSPRNVRDYGKYSVNQKRESTSFIVPNTHFDPGSGRRPGGELDPTEEPGKHSE
jgi:hypothetical protein